MNIIYQFEQFFFHTQDYLILLFNQYGTLAYGALFLIFFCETGLVITPFLPGDSLLFALGALATHSQLGLKIYPLLSVIIIAAILGNIVNYLIGRWLGSQIFQRLGSQILNPKYLERTHQFYQQYGAKTLIITRFIPIIRTFAPFIAGIGSMPYRRFIGYTAISAMLWVGSIMGIGYYFGSIHLVQQHFSLMVVAIIFISLLPVAVETVKHKLNPLSNKNCS